MQQAITRKINILVISTHRLIYSNSDDFFLILRDETEQLKNFPVELHLA